VEPGVDAELLDLDALALCGPLPPHLGNRLHHRLLPRGALDEFLHKRVFGSDAHEGDAEERVGTRGEDGERLAGFADGKVDSRAFAPSDPVLLHLEHLFRPPGQFLVVVQEALCVPGHREEPLHQVALLDLASAPLAFSRHHLFVGQHGAARRAPVDRRLLADGVPGFIELQEEPLRPPVVPGVRGGDFAGPVEPETGFPHLLAHLLDVNADGVRRMDARADRGVLRRKSEAVPPHRAEHVVAAHDVIP
jgi:hypothetical protein